MTSYSITVEAPADELYTLVADPHRHHEFHGSQTVQARARGPRELTNGARFSVHMRKYGLPYRLPLRVTQARRPTSATPGIVEWRQPTGHRWSWEFEPLDAASTRVTESYDATSQWRVIRATLRLAQVPRVNAESIQRSLRHMAKICRPPGH
ncbi:SRPBCC family protein [Nesterenkonia natronophila]|uniref:SRPBCC family protein n=1 Tax=Nesterenkonia natronophila TaxID=2174932 RepID=UPI00131492A1|nr:SRPBCC family protein [Nesterenkonia natronophila]